MLPFAILLISYIKTSVCYKIVPGQPVPHAHILDDMIRRHLGPDFTQSATLDFILGLPSNKTQNLNDTHDNLDIKVLDLENIRKIVNFTKQKYEQTEKNLTNASRRVYTPNNKYVIDRVTEQTKQAIYFTQERINATIPYRKKYRLHPSYIIAVLYGAAAAIVYKMENLLGEMDSLYYRTHFLWYLIIYERLLAANIDVSNLIEKLFLVQDQHIEMRGPKENYPAFNLAQKKTKTLPPHILQQQKVFAQFHDQL